MKSCPWQHYRLCSLYINRFLIEDSIQHNETFTIMLHIAQIRWLFEDEISSHGMANQFEASFIFILLLAASIYIPRKSSLNYSFPRFTGHISKADSIEQNKQTLWHVQTRSDSKSLYLFLWFICIDEYTNSLQPIPTEKQEKNEPK